MGEISPFDAEAQWPVLRLDIENRTQPVSFLVPQHALMEDHVFEAERRGQPVVHGFVAAKRIVAMEQLEHEAHPACSVSRNRIHTLVVEIVGVDEILQRGAQHRSARLFTRCHASHRLI